MFGNDDTQSRLLFGSLTMYFGQVLLASGNGLLACPYLMVHPFAENMICVAFGHGILGDGMWYC